MLKFRNKQANHVQCAFIELLQASQSVFWRQQY